jgi:hypothetical protein
MWKQISKTNEVQVGDKVMVQGSYGDVYVHEAVGFVKEIADEPAMLRIKFPSWTEWFTATGRNYKIHKEVPATYAFFNKEDARHLIGKKVSFRDKTDGLGYQAILYDIIEGNFPFVAETKAKHRFIQEIIPVKPQEDSKSKLIAIAKEILSQFKEEYV